MSNSRNANRSGQKGQRHQQYHPQPNEQYGQYGSPQRQESGRYASFDQRPDYDDENYYTIRSRDRFYQQPSDSAYERDRDTEHNFSEDRFNRYDSGGDGQQAQQRQDFDPDYYQWRNEQMQNLDNDYQAWRKDRFSKFSDEFNNWRQERLSQNDSQSAELQKGAEASKLKDVSDTTPEIKK